MNLRAVIFMFSGFLAASGCILAYVAANGKSHVPGVELGQPRHPVTEAMIAEAATKSQKLAKFFKLPDTKGVPTLIGGKGQRPQFIYFVKKGCPCSFDVEPLFQKLSKNHSGHVDFISVTDAGGDDAKKWVADLKVPYPVVPNPKHEVMKAFEVEASVYSVLIDTNGVIVKMWPGYSDQILGEMNEAMAKASGQAVKPFDASYAPKVKTSGCAFEF